LGPKLFQQIQLRLYKSCRKSIKPERLSRQQKQLTKSTAPKASPPIELLRNTPFQLSADPATVDGLPRDVGDTYHCNRNST
jgi:hypothetical protein